MVLRSLILLIGYGVAMKPIVKKSTFAWINVSFVFVSSIADADKVKAHQVQIEEHVGGIAK